MKKKFLIMALTAVFFATPLLAIEQGVLVGAGFTGAAKIYPYEQISYKMKWDNGIGLGVDFRTMQNVIKTSDLEPYCYFEPGLNFSYKYWYLSMGPFLFDGITTDTLTVYGRTGIANNPWDWGIGKGGYDISCDVSATFYIIDNKEDQIGSALGSIFLSMLNIAKLSAGITLEFPF